MKHHRPVSLTLIAWVGATCAAGVTAQTPLTLGDAVDSALANHPVMRAARARVESAEESVSGARAGLLPGVGLDATLTRFEEPMVATPIHSFDPTNLPLFDETLLQGRVGLEYRLFDGGERSARIRAVGAQLDATRALSHADEQSLLEEATEAYLEVLSARALLEAVSARVAALDEERARVQQNLDAGSAARVEVLRAEVELSDARAVETGARVGMRVAEQGLARIMGIPEDDVVGRALSDVAAPTTDGLEDDPTESPLVGSALSSADATRARLSEQRSARLPRVDVNAGLQDFGTLSGSHVAEWQAGVRLSWAIFSGGARSASIRRAEADVRAAEGELAAIELGVARAIDQASAAIESADARADALRVSVVQWEELARIEALTMRAGSGVQRDLLRAQAGLYQAQAGYTRARYDAVLARIRLARARGVLSRAWLVDFMEMQQ